LVSLAAFLDSYIKARAIRKANTRRNYEVTRKHLVDYFGQDKALSGISPGDADEWRHGLATPTTTRKALGEATIGREIKRARQFFRGAVRKKLIAENPFADLKAPAQVNKSREHFVTHETANNVIEACPDAEWRLIVALGRYGGLRCPSEHLSLEWSDVDWERSRVTIRSPKTEHHPNGESRQIPLFPELRPYLEEAWELAEPGSRYVITRYRDKNSNLRTQLLRIIKRAGEKPWPKLFQNLRASRETELAEQHPMHVVCAWIGNTERIAAKHYLQVRDSDFERAAESAAGAQQKAQLQTAAPIGNGSQETKKARRNRADCVPVQQAASLCDKQEHPLGVGRCKFCDLRKLGKKGYCKTVAQLRMRCFSTNTTHCEGAQHWAHHGSNRPGSSSHLWRSSPDFCCAAARRRRKERKIAPKNFSNSRRFSTNKDEPLVSYANNLPKRIRRSLESRSRTEASAINRWCCRVIRRSHITSLDRR
jgi:integrase